MLYTTLEGMVRAARIAGKTPRRYFQRAGLLSEKLHRVFISNPGDLYYRSRVGAFRDKVFGVNQGQLNVRYGLVKHKVVPQHYEPDWVDSLEDYLDKKLSFLIYQPQHSGKGFRL